MRGEGKQLRGRDAGGFVNDQMRGRRQAVQGIVRRQKNAVRAIGQERTQAFEVAAKGGDNQHAHAAEPADFCGKARRFATATAAKDDLRLVAVFDGIRRRSGSPSV